MRLLTAGSLVRARQGEPKKQFLLRLLLFPFYLRLLKVCLRNKGHFKAGEFVVPTCKGYSKYIHLHRSGETFLLAYGVTRLRSTLFLFLPKNALC